MGTFVILLFTSYIYFLLFFFAKCFLSSFVIGVVFNKKRRFARSVGVPSGLLIQKKRRKKKREKGKENKKKREEDDQRKRSRK